MFGQGTNRRAGWLAVIATIAQVQLGAQERSFEERLRALEEQNDALRQQVERQNQTIQQLQSQIDTSDRDDSPPDESADSRPGFNFGKVHLSGEGGVGVFHTGSHGQYKNTPARVDEAKLFLEAPLWEDTYFFGELDLVIREAADEFFRLGELYVDFENVLRLWTDEPWLGLRVGRIDIPFGEEYLSRDVIDNPLISHSLSDVWGVDEGIALYGKAHQFDYVIAVQNGGHPTLNDWNRDKSIAGRVGFTPNSRFRLSASAMRTGDLSAENDKLSEVWYGNGFFRAIGPAATTKTFSADLFEMDAHTYWKRGHLKVAGGYARYDDDDRAADNRRDSFYYYAEALQKLTGKLDVASRFSHIIADDGLPLVGFGNFREHFFTGPLSTELWRLSLGLRYRWNENLVTKVEYSREQGEFAGGADRPNENFLAAELGFKF